MSVKFPFLGGGFGGGGGGECRFYFYGRADFSDAFTIIKNEKAQEGCGCFKTGECLTPPLLTPLVAERAFRVSEFWGLTAVSEVHGK